VADSASDEDVGERVGAVGDDEVADDAGDAGVDVDDDLGGPGVVVGLVVVVVQVDADVLMLLPSGGPRTVPSLTTVIWLSGPSSRLG
jgi:hypothetical protein